MKWKVGIFRNDCTYIIYVHAIQLMIILQETISKYETTYIQLNINYILFISKYVNYKKTLTINIPRASTFLTKYFSIQRYLFELPFPDFYPSSCIIDCFFYKIKKQQL